MPLAAVGTLPCAPSRDRGLPGPYEKELRRQRRADAVEMKQGGLWAPLPPPAFQSYSRGSGLVEFPHLSLPLPLTLSFPFPSQIANDLF